MSNKNTTHPAIPFSVLRQAGMRARERMFEREREHDPATPWAPSFRQLLQQQHHTNGYGQLSDRSLEAVIDLRAWRSFFLAEVELGVERWMEKQSRRARHLRRHPQRRARS